MMTPHWNQHNELLYVSDLSDWWNLYILNHNGAQINLTPQPAEVGWPCWTLGTQAFDSNPSVGAQDIAVIQGKCIVVMVLWEVI
ncbi:hypothetical protein FHG87_006450 [Trinorchestia longiramus]|nr:hypothetical protein FHG87_006450 [Trinorchestia longiramus]